MTGPEKLDMEEVADLVNRALEEDLGPCDATSVSLVDDGTLGSAVILPRGACVLAGGPIAKLVFEAVDSELRIELVHNDGETVAPNEPVIRIKGRARGILAAERTALNFLQRLTGIATLTRQFVKETAGLPVQILDTRKTTPTLRALEKYAVRCGGGSNHRMGLYDRIMIKDNHRFLWSGKGRGGLTAAVRKARQLFPGLEIEVEVESVDDLAEALKERPEWILLDNMSTDLMRKCVLMCRGASKVEASGGITLENVRRVAETGVDAISLGCLTHSAKAADLTLEFLEA